MSDTRKSPWSSLDRMGPRWASVGAIAALIAVLVLVIVSWSALRTSNGKRDFEQSGSYTYRLDVPYKATALPSTVYPDGAIGTVFNEEGARVPAGPLFSNLVDTLHVDVTADVARKGSAKDVKARLDGRLTLSTPQGWSTVTYVMPTQNVGTHAVVPIDIGLAPLRAKIAEIAALTGVAPDTFNVTLDTSLTTDPGGRPSNQASDRVGVARVPLKLAVEPDLIRIAPTAETSGSGLIGERVVRAASLSVLGIPVRVDVARIIFPGLALVAIGALIAFSLVLFGGVGLSGSEQIAARYRQRIVDVAMTTAPGPVVLVSSVTELGRIARAEQTVILHQAMQDGSHRYRVVLGSVTYEYQTVPEHAGGASDFLTESEE